MTTVAASGAAITFGAQAQTMVDEKSAQATALGYVADTTRVDTKKYPKHAATQLCNNCALYQGRSAMRQRPARCFRANRWRARAGAAPEAKKPEHAQNTVLRHKGAPGGDVPG